MILVNMPFAEVDAELHGRQDLVAAIESSPSSCVVSGAAESVANFVEILKAREVKAFRVKTDIAFHSPTLDNLVLPLSQALAKCLRPKPPSVKLYSTSDPDVRTGALRDIQYWTNNMVKPVLLKSAIGAAIEDGLRLFLEVSTHPIVSHSISETLMDVGIEDFGVIPLLSRNTPAEKSILYSIAQLHCKGAHVNWEKQIKGHWVPEVPGTRWIHKPFWREIGTGPLSAGMTHDVEKHTLLGQRISIAGEKTILYTTKLDDTTKPFPGSHPLHGTEIVPAAALVNTFLAATGAQILSNIILRVPVAISAPRDLQILVQEGKVKITSRLIRSENEGSDDASWVTHTTGEWSGKDVSANVDGPLEIDIQAAKSRIGTKLSDNFSIEYLDKVGVSAMGFPWAVTEHFGNLKEMIAKVDVAPEVKPGAPLPWDAHSWAPILDAATSVGSTLFFNDPKLRMPAQIDRVVIYNSSPPPKIGYLYVEEATDSALAVHVSVLSESGAVLAKFKSMRFSEIDGTPGVSSSVEEFGSSACLAPSALLGDTTSRFAGGSCL